MRASLGAHPALSQSTTFINGLKMAPALLVARRGDIAIIENTVDAYRMEDLTRAMAVASGGGIAAAGRVMSGHHLKRVVVRDSVSQAITWGQPVREAVEGGRDPIAALVRIFGYFREP